MTEMGRLHILLAGLVAAAACSSKSSPPSPPVPIDPPAAVGSLGGNLIADGDALLATWLEPAGVRQPGAGSTRRGPHRVRFAKLAGDAWSEPVTIAEGDDVFANWADVPSLVRGGDGALVAHYARKSKGGTYAYDVALARSTDDGATWKALGLAHDDGTASEHGFVSLVPEGAGVRAFWLDGREMAGGGHGGHGSGPMTLRTALVGDTITGGEVVDAMVCDCCGTAALATGAGAVIAYRDRTQSEVRDISIARRVGDAWSAPAPVHDDGWTVPGCPVNGPAMAARGARLAVAWYTYAGERGSIRVAFSDDGGGASFASPIEVDGPRGRQTPIGRVDLQLAANGDAIVSWMVSDREQATVFVRRVTATGRVGEALPVIRARADRDAGFPRTALRGDSLGVLWTEGGEGTRLRFRWIPLAAIPAADRAPDPPADATEGLLALGAPLPVYEASALDGARVSMADANGTVTLVNLWATWCEPCRHEMPVLAALHRTHAAAGLRTIAISVDRDRTADELRAFTERRELPFDIWHDPADRASRAFGAGALPASFLFDRSGVLVWRRSGAIAERDDDLDRALAAALAGP
jgi:peroxiredoxin